MHAPGQDTSKHPHITPNKLAEYDAFLLGIPTRYGNFPAQWKAFWDQTGGLWQSGGLAGKYAGLFVSTASLGGGQESTCLASMSTLAHHGILYVPFGYSHAFGEMVDLSEVHGGSPWGAGTFAVSLRAVSRPIKGIEWLIAFVKRAQPVHASPPRKSSHSPPSKAKLSTKPFLRLSHD